MTGALELVNGLERDGTLTAEWRSAFLAVPRDQFIPDTVWRRSPGVPGMYDLVPLTRADDPSGWLDLVHRDDSVITQVDDGHPEGPGGTGRAISSSASRPSVVATMLAVAALAPGMDVCEIGTGTGYNAALMTHRLGPGHVTTIEIDPRVASRARSAVARMGLQIATVVGDGTLGYVPGAPYDRIISTCAVTEVPYAWVAQTRPGGRIVTPWGTPFHNGGLLALTVDDNGCAHGHLVGKAAFMWERGQRHPRTSVGEVYSAQDRPRTCRTELHPACVVSDDDAALAVGIRVPSCKYIYSPAGDGSGEFTLWLIDQRSRSWASVDHTPGAAEWHVDQFGPRDLWSEVEAAYRRWCAAGQPRAEGWTFHVTADGQDIHGAC